MSQQWPPTHNPGNSHQEPKKSRKWPWIVGIIVALVVGGVIAAPAPSSAPSSGTAPNPAPVVDQVTKDEITFKAEGTGTVTIHWNDGQNNHSESSVRLPWSKTIQSDEYYHSVMVSRDYDGGGSGRITCSVTKNGEVINSSEATGPYSSCMA